MLKMAVRNITATVKNQ